MRGLTGDIKFDHQGFRSDFKLDILELSEQGLVKIGVWNSTEGLNITRPVLPDADSGEENLTNRTFVVLISEVRINTILHLNGTLLYFICRWNRMRCIRNLV